MKYSLGLGQALFTLPSIFTTQVCIMIVESNTVQKTITKPRKAPTPGPKALIIKYINT